MTADDPGLELLISERVVCIYHRSDMDGRCAGAIVRNAYGYRDDPTGVDVHLVGWDYGAPVPWEEILPASCVWVVDLCLPPEDMLRLERETHLVWCDHHKTALEWAKEAGFNPPGLRDTCFSGCELTWLAARHGAPMPLAVHYLGRYDVWDHRDPKVLPFQAAVGLRFPGPADDDFWRPRLSSAYDADLLTYNLVEEGKKVLEVRDADNALRARAMAYEAEFEGHLCLVANIKPSNSRSLAAVLDPGRHEMQVHYGWQRGKWVISLYQVEGGAAVDCSAIAKARGGGGHPGAAGFTCAWLPPELLVEGRRPTKGGAA